MARFRSTLSTVAHRSPMLLAGSVSGRPHSKWWWCHDIGYPLLAAEHSPCKAPWYGTACQTTSALSRTLSPLGSARKPGFSLASSMLSALETSWKLRCINSHLSYHTIPYLFCGRACQAAAVLDQECQVCWLPWSSSLDQEHQNRPSDSATDQQNI